MAATNIFGQILPVAPTNAVNTNLLGEILILNHWVQIGKPQCCHYCHTHTHSFLLSHIQQTHTHKTPLSHFQTVSFTHSHDVLFITHSHGNNSLHPLVFLPCIFRKQTLTKTKGEQSHFWPLQMRMPQQFPSARNRWLAFWRIMLFSHQYWADALVILFGLMLFIWNTQKNSRDSLNLFRLFCWI